MCILGDALDSMLRRGIVPVVNENDTVVVEELKLGDNDRLAAIVSHLVDAAMLVMLTDTEGLYSADPRHDRGPAAGGCSSQRGSPRQDQ